MQRLKITIAYDGTNYCGWQVQPNGISIQSLVQKSLETILRHPIQLTGAGRTDSGVHALAQTAHFNSETSLTPGRLRLSANALLPPDIRILAIDPVPPSFHARYSAVGKIYHYRIHLDPAHDPFSRLYRVPLFSPFDPDLLKQAAPHCLGTHDFTSFANEPQRGTVVHDAVRTLKRLDICDEPGGLRLEFEGDGFLYKMVRNLAGTLIEIASGKRPADDIPAFSPRAIAASQGLQPRPTASSSLKFCMNKIIISIYFLHLF